MASGTIGDREGTVELISMWVDPEARGLNERPFSGPHLRRGELAVRRGRFLRELPLPWATGRTL